MRTTSDRSRRAFKAVFRSPWCRVQALGPGSKNVAAPRLWAECTADKTTWPGSSSNMKPFTKRASVWPNVCRTAGTIQFLKLQASRTDETKYSAFLTRVPREIVLQASVLAWSLNEHLPTASSLNSGLRCSCIMHCIPTFALSSNTVSLAYKISKLVRCQTVFQVRYGF